MGSEITEEQYKSFALKCCGFLQIWCCTLWPNIFTCLAKKPHDVQEIVRFAQMLWCTFSREEAFFQTNYTYQFHKHAESRFYIEFIFYSILFLELQITTTVALTRFEATVVNMNVNGFRRAPQGSAKFKMFSFRSVVNLQEHFMWRFCAFLLGGVNYNEHVRTRESKLHIVYDLSLFINMTTITHPLK